MDDVRRPVEKAALYFGIVNLIIGLAAFVGPLVTGNNDGLINTSPGLLFGIFAFNWFHALAHILIGAAGILVARSCESSRTYMWVSAAIFGVLTVAGFIMVGMEMDPQLMMGMAVNGADNLLHLLWTALTLFFAYQASRQTAPEVSCA
ncbi:MAG: DUF4383 domain-containing protein [Anaerolineaceae bacterium]|nr:DUF4383 domain-containing protein [Anaerolineaceae bacterium]